MKKIKVLIVDDSGFAREIIAELLSDDDEIEIIGEAKNGNEAIKMNVELSPDIITMDIEMPVMNGLDAIEEIMSSNPVPILVITSKNNALTAYSALSNGALEVIDKPDIYNSNKYEFIQNIKNLSKLKVITHIKNKKHAISKINDNKKKLEINAPKNLHNKIIAIASSTGGPKAISIILSELPENFNLPIVIAQHISAGFENDLVKWLNSISHLSVKIAENGEKINPGYVYVIPPTPNSIVNSNGIILFQKKIKKNIYHPCCDLLLSSVATCFGSKNIGIILTGMGKDGVNGIVDIKNAGGITIAQDKDTSAVFGMPKLAIESGFVDLILPIQDIACEINKITSKNNYEIKQNS